MDKYRHTEYKAGLTIDVIETYPSKLGLRMTRERYNGRTPEAMKKYNDKLQARKLTRLINANFKPNDFFVTLNYFKDKRPNPETAAAQLTAFLRALKRLYKKHSAELKYIKVSAYGSKGGIHHHIVINNIGININTITALWRYSERKPKYEPLYNTGEYSGLANYLIKQLKSNGAEKITGKRYSGSRNLKQPELIKDKYISKIQWCEPPTAKIGYYIDKDSIDAGVNEYNGKPYLFYRLIKIPPDCVTTDGNGNKLKGKEAIKQIRLDNREYIKKLWYHLAPLGKIVPKVSNEEKTIL